MNESSILEVHLVAEDHRPLALGRVTVEVVLFVRGRERYRFDVGVTDDNGRITAPYSLFEKIRKDNQSFALMDYNTTLGECDPEVVVRVPSVEELQRRLQALTKWFPENASSMTE